MSAAVQDLEGNLGKPFVAETSAVQNDPLDTIPWLPCTLTLELPVVHFTVGDLLSLQEGSIVETACHHTCDVPLRVNQLLIGWTEFEMVGDRLAVRITEKL
jgi:flagellar motor switch/type III secretory pathway protein FliN